MEFPVIVGATPSVVLPDRNLATGHAGKEAQRQLDLCRAPIWLA
jgi:hypothetical protein